MKIGLLMAFHETTARPGPFAAEAERLGFESLWAPEHPILPVDPKTPFPAGGPIPDVYSHMSDQFVCLAMAAATTSKLKLATGITLVPEHSPIVTAKQIATLDYFSGGRVIWGIGAGWLREESEIMGVDFPRRWTQTAEYVAAMRALWTEPEASYEGKYVKFPAVRCYPKPVQKGGPPVLLGSRDKNELKRVVKWGDGWFPNRVTVEEMNRDIAALKEECQAAGRDFGKLDITVMGGIQGDRAATQKELERYAAAGVGRFVVALGTLKPNDYQARLAKLAEQYV